MIARRALPALAAAILGASLIAPSGALAAAPAPAWSIQTLAVPTNFKPGEESGLDTYEAFLANSGGEVTDHSQITITDALPAGLAVKSVALQPPRGGVLDLGPAACETEASGEQSTVTCEVTDALLPAKEPAKLYPGNQLRLTIKVKVPPSVEGPLSNRVAIEGGGGGEVSAEIDNEASQAAAPAGFEEFHAALTGPDGRAATGADSHPYQYTTSFAIDTATTPPGAKYPVAPAGGDLKEIEVALAPGLIGNPTATPRCSAQQFVTTHGAQGEEGDQNVFPNECPDGSAVGLVAIEQLDGVPVTIRFPLYNLIPPPGMPARLGFVIGGAPVYIDTALRSDGDYGITASLHNTTEAKKVTAAQVTIWGNTADPSHDPVRGKCAEAGGSCPAEVPERPFLRLPSSCEGPLQTTMRFDTWLHPGTFVSALFGEAAPVGCELPDFSPSIEAKPTTNVADAPSGLHFDLHLPQAANEDPAGLGEADLRGATVTLPQGLLVNPSSANGRTGCSAAEIGLITPVGQSPIRFSAAPPKCPDASKLGSVEVDTPLIDHSLPGAVYLAMPHENPFDSLIAIYITVADPQTGVVVKLPGHVEPDPATGQLRTTVQESPQTPFEDFKLDFFEGARAPLRTPATCGTHTTTTDLKPWTSPAFGPDATPSDSFQITQGAGGGAVPPRRLGSPTAPASKPEPPPRSPPPSRPSPCTWRGKTARRKSRA